MNSAQINRLVVRAKTDDRAFAQLAKHLDRMIHWVAYKWGPRHAQDQAYQDALLALWKAVKDYEPDTARANFKTVATAYMRNAVLPDRPRAIDTITEGIDLQDIEWLVGAEDANIQQLLDASEAQTLLALLTDKQRQAIELVYGFTPAGPMSIKDAAENIGVSAPVIGRRRIAAINRLRSEHGLDKLRTSGLTDSQRAQVKARFESGISKAQLAREYGVSSATITRIVEAQDYPMQIR